MAAANLTTHGPILAVQTRNGNTPFTSALPEKASQTFLSGVPVQLNTAYVQAWDGTTYTAGILGVSESSGSNLATNGVGAPVPPFGGVTGNISTVTFGSVPSQAGAVNIPLGAPFTDGRTLYTSPDQDVIYQALFDNSNGTVAANWTPTNSDIGVSYGLTMDANGFWYVDKAKTTTSGGGASNQAVVQIVGLPMGSYLNAPVNFVFLAAAVQVL